MVQFLVAGSEDPFVTPLRQYGEHFHNSGEGEPVDHFGLDVHHAGVLMRNSSCWGRLRCASRYLHINILFLMFVRNVEILV